MLFVSLLLQPPCALRPCRARQPPPYPAFASPALQQRCISFCQTFVLKSGSAPTQLPARFCCSSFSLVARCWGSSRAPSSAAARQSVRNRLVLARAVVFGAPLLHFGFFLIPATSYRASALWAGQALSLTHAQVSAPLSIISPAAFSPLSRVETSGASAALDRTAAYDDEQV